MIINAFNAIDINLFNVKYLKMNLVNAMKIAFNGLIGYYIVGWINMAREMGQTGQSVEYEGPHVPVQSN